MIKLFHQTHHAVIMKAASSQNQAEIHTSSKMMNPMVPIVIEQSVSNEFKTILLLNVYIYKCHKIKHLLYLYRLKYLYFFSLVLEFCCLLP